jgi:hypothetical protein
VLREREGEREREKERERQRERVAQGAQIEERHGRLEEQSGAGSEV